MGTRQKTAEPTDLKESLDFAADAVIKYNFGNTNWIPLMLRDSSFIIQPEEILADVDLLIAMEGVLASGCRVPVAPPWRSRARSVAERGLWVRASRRVYTWLRSMSSLG